MSDKTGIAWPSVTILVDRGGRRIRFYKRKKPDSPGRRTRTEMALVGKKWCRICKNWLLLSDITKNGLCREHENQQYREWYAKNPTAIRARVHARKRGIDPVPQEAYLVAELFDNKCAYCGGPNEAWDHIYPISLGGKTIPHNIVPVCTRCNSSKKAMPLAEWLDRGGQITEYMFEYTISMNLEL